MPVKKPTTLKGDSAAQLDLITQRNQQNSPLLRLPPELRITIYGYALGGNTWYLMHIHETGPPVLSASPCILPHPWTLIHPRIENGLALLRVCRQLHAETSLQPFQLNTFVNDSWAFLKPRLLVLLDEVPGRREAITSVRLGVITRMNRGIENDPCLRCGSLKLPALKRIHLEITTGSDQGRAAINNSARELDMNECNIAEKMLKDVQAGNTGVGVTMSVYWRSGALWYSRD